MKLEIQVTSPDLSKRLRELGVVQNSAFRWANFETEASPLGNPWLAQGFKDLKTAGDSFRFDVAAFTVAELGVMLPNYIDTWRCTYVKSPWQCADNRDGETEEASLARENFEATTEADARAKMLIHLIENKIISVEEVNARLEAA